MEQNRIKVTQKMCYGRRENRKRAALAGRFNSADWNKSPAAVIVRCDDKNRPLP